MSQDSISKNSGFLQFLTKALILGVIATLSIGGGVYVGSGHLFENKTNIQKQRFINDSNLNAGDKFPAYQLYNLVTKEFELIENVSNSQPTLLFFLSNSCSVCFDLVKKWNEEIFGKIDENIKIVFVLDGGVYQTLDDVDDAFMKSNAVLYTSDRTAHYPIDGINAFPTIVGVFSDGEISFVSSGLDYKVDTIMVEELMLK